MHPAETYAAARELVVPRGTIVRWLQGGRQGRRPEPPRPLPEAPYAYLLGLYLGDGHIARGGHGQHVLSIACDRAHPGIIEAARAAVQTVVPTCSVFFREHPRANCTRVVAVSRWWPVLFPQHGPGRKHERPIRLSAWQRVIAEVRARDLVRGLIHSDGCRFLARQRVGGKTYEYVRYCFSNRSGDLLTIFSDPLDLLGIGWTRPNEPHGRDRPARGGGEARRVRRTEALTAPR